MAKFNVRRFYKKYQVLIFIVLIGFAVRAYRINQVPLYGDELTMVYDSYSILKTGMDATGKSYPLTFSMGSGRPGGYIYFSLPFVALFGPTALGVRSLSLLSGLGIIILMFYLGKKVFNPFVGIIASMFASVSPWEIYLSRAGFEAHFAMFLALAGLVAFLYASAKNKLYYVWAISWGLALLTYPTFKLTLPLMFLLLYWYKGNMRKQIGKRFLIIPLVILMIFGGVAARETIFGTSENRFSQINIFANSDLTEYLKQKVNYERTISTLPEGVKPLFISAPIEFGRILLDTHLLSLSSDFMFLTGDRNPRHNPGELGMLYLADIIFILAGLLYIWNPKKKEFLLIIIWVLTVPLATMLLGEVHGLRNAFMLPPLILLTSYGVTKLSPRLLKIALVILAVQFVYILQRVYFVAPNKFATFWSKSARDAVELAEEKKNQYNTIYISSYIDNIEYAYPVYAKIDPRLVISQYNQYPKKYDNVQIVDLDTQLNSSTQNALVITEKETNALDYIPGVQSFEIGK